MSEEKDWTFKIKHAIEPVDEENGPVAYHVARNASEAGEANPAESIADRVRAAAEAVYAEANPDHVAAGENGRFVIHRIPQTRVSPGITVADGRTVIDAEQVTVVLGDKSLSLLDLFTGLLNSAGVAARVTFLP